MLVITLITQEEQWPVTKMFPWRRNENSTVIQWDQITFNDHMLDRVPEEGVSRLVTQKKSSNSASLQRFGLALIVEHGFYKEKKGKENWAMNLRQIANAVIETACFGAVVAAVHTIPYVDENDKWREISDNSIMDLEAQFRDEICQTAALQKGSGGFEMLVARGEGALNGRNGNPGDFWLWPKGTRAYAKGTLAESMFLFSGRKSGEERDVVGAAMKGAVYKESRGFRKGEGEPLEDPCIREQTIGDHWIMNSDGIRDVLPEEFRWYMMDRIVYNANSDSMVLFSFIHNFKYAGLFEKFEDESSSYPLSHIGEDFFGDFATWYDYFVATQSEDYVVESLYMKSIEVHQDFLKLIASINESIIKTETEEVTRTPLQPASGGSMNIKSSINNMINGSSWSDNIQNAAKQFTSFLGDLQSKDPSIGLLEQYHSFVEKHKNDELEGIHNINWGLLSTQLLEYDKLWILAAIQSKSSFEKSAFEKIFTQLKSKMSNASNANDLEIVMEEAHNADIQSPSWKPLPNFDTVIHIKTTPSASIAEYKVLEYNSLSYSFASINLVLFEVDENTLQSLIHNNVQIDMSKVKSSDPVKRDVMRVGLLQFSVVLSAIYARLVQYNDQIKDETNETIIKLLLKDIKSLIKREVAVFGNTTTMPKVSNYIMSNKFIPMYSQFFARTQIEGISYFLCKYYTDKMISDDDVEKMLINIAESIEDCVVDISAHDQSETGSMMSNKYKHDAEEISNKSNHEIQIIGRIEDAWERARITLENEEKTILTPTQQTSKSTLFSQFSNQLILITMLLEARSTDKVSATSKKVVLNQILKFLNSKFYATGSRKTNREKLRAYLKLAKDHVIGDNPSGEFKPTEIALKNELQTANLQTPLIEAILNAGGIDVPDDVTQTISFKQKMDLVASESNPTKMKVTAERLFPTTSKKIEDTLINKIVRAYAEFKTDIEKGINSVLKSDISAPLSPEEVRGAYMAVLSAANIIIPSESRDPKVIKANVDYFNYINNIKIEQNTVKKLSKRSIENILKQLPIDGKLVKWAFRRDVYIPIQLICARPHQRFEFGSAVHVNSSKAGNTLYAHPDFQLGDNVAQKMHYGNFTINLKTVVWDPKHLIVLRNVLVTGYKGGFGVQCWDPLDEMDVEDYTSNVLDKDIFVIPEYANRRIDANVFDITGRFHQDLKASVSASRQIDYTLSKTLSSIWSWKNLKGVRLLYDSNYHEARYNTLCFKGHNQFYSKHDGKMSNIESAKGHFGQIYAGIARVFTGNELHFKQISYDSNNLMVQITA